MHFTAPERGTAGSVGTTLPQELRRSNNVDPIYILKLNHRLVQVSDSLEFGACPDFKLLW